jgi:hypothetical protein
VENEKERLETCTLLRLEIRRLRKRRFGDWEDEARKLRDCETNLNLNPKVSTNLDVISDSLSSSPISTSLSVSIILDLNLKESPNLNQLPS